MSKDWRTILRFAVTGIGVAIVFFVFDKTDFFTKSWAGIWMFWAALVICLAWFFVFVLVVNATELPVPDSSLVWLIIVLVNCLYDASTSTCGSRVAGWLRFKVEPQ